MPHFTFCWWREHKTTPFFFFSWTSIQSIKIQLQKKMPTFDELKFEGARHHFSRGVFLVFLRRFLTDPTPPPPPYLNRRRGSLTVGAKKTRGNSLRVPSAFPLTSGGELPYFNALSYAIETKIKVNPWEPVDNCLENLLAPPPPPPPLRQHLWPRNFRAAVSQPQTNNTPNKYLLG